MNAREYRDHLYRSRSHPELRSIELSEGFYDNRDSFSNVYLSILPFLALEYYCEISYELLPSGLVFPTGYLLFWAFYYSFYQPGFLENKLSSPQKWDLNGIPTVLLGVMIWFVKVSVVELTHFFVRTVLGIPGSGKGSNSSRPKAARETGFGKSHEGAKARASRPEQSYSGGPRSAKAETFSHANANRQSGPREHAQEKRQTTPPPFPPKTSQLLPTDLKHALQLLGLNEGAQWAEIHRRYRELAKQYHPDLNHDITDVGRRFMMYDAAYRKLFAVRAKYFPEKRSHG